MFIVVTQVDAQTKQPCTVQPMRTGPAYPALNNLQVLWQDESNRPIAVIAGVYQTAPLFYGTCDDDSFTGFPGVIEVIDEAAFTIRKRTEYYARRPFPSWVFDEATLTWSAPIPMPTDGKMYKWDDATTSWIAQERPA